jgi:putative addiction module killer protein
VKGAAQRLQKLEFEESGEFATWLEGLDQSVGPRINACLDRIEANGKFPKTCKPLENADGVWEMTFDFGPGYRIYYCRTRYIHSLAFFWYG